MLKTPPKLSKREWEIMNICWRQKDITVQEVITYSSEEEKRHYQTVKAQLEVLLKKGYLEREKRGTLWLYKPRFSKMEVVKNEVLYFIEKVIGTCVFPVFINLMNDIRVSPDELEQLKELVKNISDDVTTPPKSKKEIKRAKE